MLFAKFFSNLIATGTAHLAFSVANRIKITNLIGIITTAISGLYTLNYVFILDNMQVAGINLLFTIAYAATLVFNKFHAPRGSKIWFFCVLMLHLVVCTNVYVTNASGFHLYYFLVPTGAFLLFELSEKKEKVGLSLISVVLFFFCENTLNENPLIVLSDELNHMLYQSVILVNMLEVILVLTIFAKEIEVNELKLTRQATTDALTGAANRHAFFEQGERIFSRSNSDIRPVSVAILDIDHFKQINDQYGHFVGDVCLKEITELLTAKCRPQDFFARLGGEEFAIILPDTTLSEANNLIEQMRLTIETHQFSADDLSFHCTASFGIASVVESKESLKDLLVHADKALYNAKSQGRNRVQLFQAVA